MKVSTATILLLLIGALLFGTPSANDVTVAVAAITDGTISAVAAYLNTPALQLPGLTIEREAHKPLPHQLRFKKSDIASFTPYFQPKKPGNQSFFGSLLESARGPLNPIALQFLTVHEWEVGHAVLDGVATTEWSDGLTLTALVGRVMSGQALDPLLVDVDVVVSGTRLSVPVHVVGSFVIESSGESFVDIRPISLDINGSSVLQSEE